MDENVIAFRCTRSYYFTYCKLFEFMPKSRLFLSNYDDGRIKAFAKDVGFRILCKTKTKSPIIDAVPPCLQGV